MLPVRKIISGGQTGVDRAALNVAIQLGIPCGGRCPRGRLAEDGPISLAYPLVETVSEKYESRTEWNVRDADATLIIAHGEPTGGTAYTITMCRRHKKPYYVLDLESGGHNLQDVAAWLIRHKVRTLNVAGPRESTRPGIGEESERILTELLGGIT